VTGGGDAVLPAQSNSAENLQLATLPRLIMVVQSLSLLLERWVEIAEQISRGIRPSGLLPIVWVTFFIILCFERDTTLSSTRMSRVVQTTN